MKVWPVPNSYEKKIPKDDDMGSFWENRGDRRHCGVDIFAPEGSEAIAVESGYVIDKGEFSVEKEGSYYNSTYFIIVKCSNKNLVKYAKLKEVFVHIGDYVEAGQPIGELGKVIDEEKVTVHDPMYVQELKEKNRLSMLHLEIYKAPVTVVQPYEMGNYLGDRRPESLIDPSLYLNGVLKGKK